MSGCSRLKVSLARLMILKTVAVLIGQTCGSIQRVEQELLELGTCCTCIEGVCISTAGVIDSGHDAWAMPLACSSDLVIYLRSACTQRRQ